MNIAALRMVAAGLMAASATAHANPSPSMEQWQFRVWLDDRAIGHHHFVARSTGDQVDIQIDAQFEVSWWILTAYQYEHANVETWRDGCLHALESRTNDDGDQHRVEGRLDGDAFVLSANDETTTHDHECARSFAYWNPDALQSGPMLNAQTGEWIDVSVSAPAMDSVTINGKPVDAVRRELDWPEGDITVWHRADDSRWIGLEAAAPGGRTLRYEPVSD